MKTHSKQEKNQTLLRMGFAFLVSFAILAVCSKNSFLYPMNDWVDVNCFFTVGRGITHGLVPYRDLYDQKGPLLYYIYALAALISEHSFLGVFVIETLLFALFLHIGGRMAELLSEKPSAFWLTVSGLGLGLPLSPAFSHGGSAEEFFLPAFAGALYIVLKAMREHRPFTRSESALLGVFAAAALWTKYTFCGLFAGLAVAVLVWYLADRMGKALLPTVLWALIGAAAASLAVLSWYSLNGSIRSPTYLSIKQFIKGIILSLVILFNCNTTSSRIFSNRRSNAQQYHCQGQYQGNQLLHFAYLSSDDSSYLSVSGNSAVFSSGIS